MIESGIMHENFGLKRVYARVSSWINMSIVLSKSLKIIKYLKKIERLRQTHLISMKKKRNWRRASNFDSWDHHLNKQIIKDSLDIFNVYITLLIPKIFFNSKKFFIPKKFFFRKDFPISISRSSSGILIITFLPTECLFRAPPLSASSERLYWAP